MTLGIELTPLVGRRQELTEVRRLLSSSARLVTLTGPGGIGKTRLARKVAEDQERSRRGAVWAIDLADLVDPALLVQSVADVVGVHLPHADVPLTDLADALRDRHGLLLLDGCEQLVDESTELVATLLRRCPHLRVLAAGRQPLGITGEAVVRVPPLSSPEPGAGVSPDELATYDAAVLFVQRAATVLPTFRVTDDNAAAIAGLCQELDGVPLSLELAAARILVLSPQEILDRLGDSHRLLSKGSRGAPSRQQSLRASIDASYELCTPGEQMLWTRLTVFAGGFDLEAAETVCSGEGIDRLDILDMVDSLLEKSVLGREEADAAHVRYRMLEALRQYAAEKLDDEARRRWRRRHLDWCFALVDEAAGGWFGPRQVEWCDRFRQEHGNVRTALETSLSEPDLAPRGLLAAVGLEPYWVVTGRLGEGRRWLALTLAREGGSDADRARASSIASWMATIQTDHQAAQELLDRARQLAEQAGDDASRAATLLAEAVQAIWQGRAVEASASAREAERMFRDAADRQGEATARFLQGLALEVAGDPDEAAAALRACLSLTEAADERHLGSYAQCALGLVSLDQGRLEEAEDLERDALRAKSALGDQFSVALIFEVMAWVAAAREEAERAATLLGAAAGLWQHLGFTPSSVPFLAGHRASGESQARELIRSRTFQSLFTRGAALPPDLAVTFALEEAPPAAEGDELMPSPLTGRELEVAALIGRGMSNKEIAVELSISQRTVQGHVENMLRKLDFSSRAQVAVWVTQRDAATRHGSPRLFATGGDHP